MMGAIARGLVADPLSSALLSPRIQTPKTKIGSIVQLALVGSSYELIRTSGCRLIWRDLEGRNILVGGARRNARSCKEVR